MYIQKGLAELEQQIQIDFENLNISPKTWVITPHDFTIDVAIIGAGMSALALALALFTQGIRCILFEKEQDGQEGPWVSPALMQTLRSPKHVVGPALNFPSLTFQAWFKAQFGLDAWEELDKIPRLQWHAYLQWFKKMIAAHIVYEHELIDLEVKDNGTELTFQYQMNTVKYNASHTVLAMGIDSLSQPNIPKFMQGISSENWEHSYSGSDYKKFKQLDIAVIGYSASAMDSAATALEYGARSVELLCRCKDLPRVNRGKVASNPGYLESYRYWPDAKKWQFQHYLKQSKTPAPYGSTLRVSKHSNAYFNFDQHISHIEQHHNKLHIYTQNDCYIVDHLILATGYTIHWSKFEWLKHLENLLIKWKDIYTAPVGLQDQAMAEQPYLSTDFEFQSKSPNIDISHIYCFNYSASLSQGSLVGMISGLHSGAHVLAAAIAKKLYLASYDQHMYDIQISEEYELNGHEWNEAPSYSNRSYH